MVAKCEVCGNEYDKAFRVEMPGDQPHIFDSFECAIHALAPTCENCGVRIVGHGVEADGSFFCCAHCASMAGVSRVEDRAESERDDPPRKIPRDLAPRI